MKVVRPRRKMSQWKPGGLRRGNSLPWAIREETVCFVSCCFAVGCGWLCLLTVVIEPEEDREEEAEGESEEDFSCAGVPEVDEP